jgi:hypothetical protein
MQELWQSWIDAWRNMQSQAVDIVGGERLVAVRARWTNRRHHADGPA